MGRLLDPISLRIVEVDPVLIFSLEYSQLRLPSYPLPAAPRFVRKSAYSCRFINPFLQWARLESQPTSLEFLTFESNGNASVLFPVYGRPGEAYKIGQQWVVTRALVGGAAGFVLSGGV